MIRNFCINILLSVAVLLTGILYGEPITTVIVTAGLILVVFTALDLMVLS